MRLCLRLAVLTALLVALAIGLVALRTETHQAGNRLHSLFREKRDLEKDCYRLELAIGRLKSQMRLRERVADLYQEPTDEFPGRPADLSPGARPGRRPSRPESRSASGPP